MQRPDDGQGSEKAAEGRGLPPGAEPIHVPSILIGYHHGVLATLAAVEAAIEEGLDLPDLIAHVREKVKQDQERDLNELSLDLMSRVEEQLTE